jgi:hypothetical protein
MSQELEIEKIAAVLIQIFWKLARKVVVMISMSSLNISHLPSKARSHCPNMEKTLFTH